MTTSAPAPAPFRRYDRLLLALAGRRSAEVAALQAPPLLGTVLGGELHAPGAPVRMALLLLGSLALTGHVFIFNDWANYYDDLKDAQRIGRLSGEGRQERRAVLTLALILLSGAALLLGATGPQALVFGGGVALLGVAYSSRSPLGKASPGGASLNHLVGGSLHFLLGYTVAHRLDPRGVALSLFFGLVFAAGHLNQELRDREADALVRVRTAALVFGARKTFYASVILFSTAYLLLLCLAAVGLLPPPLALVAVAWVVQMLWSRNALTRGLNRDAAVWLQRRYRLLFAAIGVALVLTAA